MSLVEKALEKLRAGHDADAAKVRARPEPAAEKRTAPGEWRPTVAEPFTAEQSRRIVKIDERALRAARVLAPEDEARRASNEFRAIKRELITEAFSGTDDSFERRLVVMSSAMPGDGKTHTSINLALSMAQERDCSVILIDGDVAKPHISELLGLTEEPGLIDLLASDDKDVRSVLLATDRPNLWVLPAGRRSEIATELLASQRMREVCSQLAYMLPQAIMLLDSPPILVTSEAVELASLAGQVVLVVKAGETPRQAVLDAVARIGDESRVKLVLNQVPTHSGSSYYYGHWLTSGNQSGSGKPPILRSPAGRE